MKADEKVVPAGRVLLSRFDMGMSFGVHCAWASTDGQPQSEVYSCDMLKLENAK